MSASDTEARQRALRGYAARLRRGPKDDGEIVSPSDIVAPDRAAKDDEEDDEKGTAPGTGPHRR